ncbi:porimin-like [Myzus persicae]|uniref:porimin-like n=1 Tax=Myzus persicae TaxID=13164 RepID=UPI000B933555|nr:porimin-like [Myzus persicae]
MVLLKTTVVVLLAVAYVSAANLTAAVKAPKEHVEHISELSVGPEPTQPSPAGNTTVNPPIPNNSTTSIPTTQKPTTTTTTTTTQRPTSTTLSPNVTTHAPNVTTTTSSPNVTTTTLGPNVTTTIPPTPEPTPAPSPARSWDGPSFLGGMVLAFGIVAVGFVGYRFFYLGRGGAYHTL